MVFVLHIQQQFLLPTPAVKTQTDRHITYIHTYTCPTTGGYIRSKKNYSIDFHLRNYLFVIGKNKFDKQMR